MLHKDLFNWLKAESAVTAIFADRVYHMAVPQGVKTWPALTFQQVSLSEVSPDFEAPNDAKIDQSNWQFDIVSDRSSTVVTASETFNTIFRNFRGTMGATKILTVELGNMQQLDERIGDKIRRRVVLDYAIFFNV